MALLCLLQSRFQSLIKVPTRLELYASIAIAIKLVRLQHVYARCVSALAACTVHDGFSLQFLHLSAEMRPGALCFSILLYAQLTLERFCRSPCALSYLSAATAAPCACLAWLSLKPSWQS